MIKNILVSGRMHALFIPQEEDYEHNLLEVLQTQAEHIELLEEQNDALIRQEHILLQLLELSSQTSRAITDSLLELKKLLSDDPNP